MIRPSSQAAWQAHSCEFIQSGPVCGALIISGFKFRESAAYFDDLAPAWMKAPTGAGLPGVGWFRRHIPDASAVGKESSGRTFLLEAFGSLVLYILTGDSYHFCFVRCE